MNDQKKVEFICLTSNLNRQVLDAISKITHSVGIKVTLENVANGFGLHEHAV